VCAQVASRAWVVKDDEKHFAPEMLVKLMVDDGAKGVTCLGKRCSYASVT